MHTICKQTACSMFEWQHTRMADYQNGKSIELRSKFAVVLVLKVKENRRLLPDCLRLIHLCDH